LAARSRVFLLFALAAILVIARARGARAQQASGETESQTEFETLGSPPESAGEGFPPLWTFKSGRTMQLLGRIDADSLWTTQSAGNMFTYGDLGDVVGLRRARIGVDGDLLNDRRYKFEVDLATGQVVPRDIFLAHGSPPNGERRWGHYREPFSLEGNISANYYQFMERSPINALDPARGWGLCIYRCAPSEDATFALGIFHNGSDFSDFDAGDGANGSVTGKLTWAPILKDDGRELAHLGFAFSERIPEDGVATFDQHPRATLLDPSDSTLSPFVPELLIPSHFVQLFNLQTATCHGPLWTQSEWYGAIVTQINGDPVWLRGFYVSAGYFLTGENRKYEKETGILGPVKVARPLVRGSQARDRPRGWGSWEVTARFSWLNYMDPSLPPPSSGDNVGIVLPQATFGVNWHLAERVRIMFNYSYEAPNEVNLGVTEASVFGMRLNAFF
jgi:phosphate-selective porin OprO/OprP